MDNSNSIKYDKLIRDKIPEVIEATGSKAVVEVLDDERYQKYLERKLGEELKEYLEAGSIEELADLIEVVYALLESRGISLEEFERIRVAKVEKRGAFKKKLLLREVKGS
ncbi:MAG TPA: nucleoside triphosphate pyrophosphohydrolase [Clostridiaceae bacterium]|jgi:predicted house-cleaning noncanonical NTP pyrophosphatase (MazG superfamily)|nr:nucleoside triphosphate pyrophosphohydrolase [Clostridiaceae bacterium]